MSGQHLSSQTRWCIRRVRESKAWAEKSRDSQGNMVEIKEVEEREEEPWMSMLRKTVLETAGQARAGQNLPEACDEDIQEESRRGSDEGSKEGGEG
jgi:hypothetical protein